MRISSIILLSSAALALLVQAENASPNASITVPVLAEPVAASPDHDAKAQAQTSMQVNTDAKDEKKPAEVPPKEEAANDAKANKNNNETKDTKDNMDTKDTKDTKDTEDAKNKETEPRPVGKGIVVTTTSFSKSTNGGFLANLLGIDMDMNIGDDGKDKMETVKKMNGDLGNEMVILDDVPLYGDADYVPRPLPAQPTGQPPCPPLMFLDQVVWDMQGSSSEIIEVSSPPTRPPVPAPVTTPVLRDATAPATLPGTEVVDQSALADATVHADGVRICLLGICIGGPEDKDKDDDGPKPRKKRIRHNMRKFLRKVAKRSPLSIDGQTGCPIPSTMAQDVKP
ncbi:hypothetical protein BG006_008782 [Podila minutissima]|uniref:Uncharacterized protein n=1 Tax=Podila minutissima TaxID=64525 RepID=A0A9P5VJC3_9FUNG|nr:hypothetical protein BG006_008782 [Podila minutissima]